MDIQEEYKQIKELTEQEKYSEALLRVDALLKVNAKDDWAWYLKGNIYKKQEMWQPAIDSYTEAISINRQNPAT